MITIDSCYNEAHNDLTFNVIGATMAYYNLTFNVIGATLANPSPLLAYINQEFVAITRNCLDGTLSLLIVSRSARGWVGRQQATFLWDPSALLREVPLPLSAECPPQTTSHDLVIC